MIIIIKSVKKLMRNLSKNIAFRVFKQDFPNGIDNPNDFELVNNNPRYKSEFYYNYNINIFKTNIYNPAVHYFNIWGCNFFSTGELAVNNTEYLTEDFLILKDIVNTLINIKLQVII